MAIFAWEREESASPKMWPVSSQALVDHLSCLAENEGLGRSFPLTAEPRRSVKGSVQGEWLGVKAALGLI